MDLATLAILTSSLLCIVYAFKLIYSKKNEGAPGPWGFPVVGHLPLLGSEPWKTFLRWKKKYGPIIAVRFGSFNVVAVTDEKLIREVFRRSAVAGRAPLELFAVSNHKGLSFGSGPLVREQRNFVIKLMKELSSNSTQVEDAILSELNEVFKVMDNYRGQPIKCHGQIFAAGATNIVWSLFVQEPFALDDERIKFLTTKTAAYFEMDGLLPNLAAFIPWIPKYFPEASGMNKQQAAGRAVYDFMKERYDDPLPLSYVPGEPRNYREAFMEERERNKNNPNSSFHESHDMFHTVVGDIFFATMDTVRGCMDWFLNCMVLNPRVQEKVFKDIEYVVGMDRLPTLSDRPKLPYVDAVMFEQLRFTSFVPIGMFRQVTEDINFQGYKVPKETLVLSNLYGVHHDPDIWGDPQVFRPERFIDAQGNLQRIDECIPFSVGKRSCIGSNLARDLLFLFYAGLVQRYQISGTSQNPANEQGVPGFVIQPHPFDVVFTRRTQIK